MIVIVDYGMGNLRNVRRAFEKIGVQAAVTDDAAVIGRAEKLVLPGVGAFGEAVRRIDALGLRGPILSHALDEKPLLGICLGMQLLYESSEESPGAAGLGLLRGTVKRFDGSVKVPHIGWNDVTPGASSVLFGDARTAEPYYFVHSYYAPQSTETLALTLYGLNFTSAVGRQNVLGVQFHPEKSQDAGLALLTRFAGI